MERLVKILWILGFCLITWDMFLSFDVRGYTLKVYYPLFALSFVFLFLHLKPQKFLVEWKEFSYRVWPILGVLAYAILGSFWSLVPQKSLVYSTWLLFDIYAIAFPFYAVFSFRKDAQWIVKATIFSLIYLSVILFVDHYGYFHGRPHGIIGFNQDTLLKWGMSRPHAFAYEPSYLASFFSIAIGICLIPIILLQKKLWPIAIIAMVFSSFSLAILGSRTGWISSAAFIASVSIWHLFKKQILKQKFRILSTLGTFVALFFIFLALQPEKQKEVLDKNLVKTVQEGNDGSGNSRLKAMERALIIGRDSNFLGVGIGASYLAFLRQDTPNQTLTVDNLGAELIMSIWGQSFAELGLAGTILLFLWFILLQKDFLNALKTADKEKQIYLLVCQFACAIFFLFIAHWIGNLARSDIWVWFAIWLAFTKKESAHEV